MGKILEYLNIDSKEQPTDVLDAERLLEGMQKIYSNATDSKKKDNFGNLLAEMTKTFIEVVNGEKKPDIDTIEEVEQQQAEEQEIEDIESVESETESQQEEEQQNQEQQAEQQEREESKPKFKQGDKVVVLRDKPYGADIIKGDILTFNHYNNDGSVSISNKEGAIWYVTEKEIKLYKEQEQLPFKVGDKFKVPYESEKIFTISSFAGSDVIVSWDNNKETNYSIEEAKDNLREGRWVLLKETENLPFKDGDKFKVLNNNKVTYNIKQIYPDKIIFTYLLDGEAYVSEQDLKEAVDLFKTGYYYLVNESNIEFKVGDKFKMDGDIKVYTIENINNQEKLITISYSSVRGRGNVDYDDNLNNFKYKWDKGIYKKYDEQQPQSTTPQSSKPKVLSAEDKQRIKDIKLEIKGLQLLDDDEDAVQLIKELEEEMNMIKNS